MLWLTQSLSGKRSPIRESTTFPLSRKRSSRRRSRLSLSLENALGVIWRSSPNARKNPRIRCDTRSPSKSTSSHCCLFLFPIHLRSSSQVVRCFSSLIRLMQNLENIHVNPHNAEVQKQLNENPFLFSSFSVGRSSLFVSYFVPV